MQKTEILTKTPREIAQARTVRSQFRLLNVFVVTAIITFTGFFILIALFSLQWRMVHDSPIMLYLAFLVDKLHYVPYRDVLDINMLGAYLLNILMSRVFGYSDLGFRLSDLAYLAGIMLVTWYLLKDLGREVAWWAAVLFGILYLDFGPLMSMEREYQMILPVAAALMVSTSFPRLNDGLRYLIAGVLIGFASTIKPHVALVLPLIIAFHVLEIRQRNNRWLPQTIVMAIVVSTGFAIPLLIMIYYMWISGGLASYVDVSTNYLPLFRQISKGGIVRPESERLFYLLEGYLATWRYNSILTVLAVLGTVAALFVSTLSSAQKRKVILLVAVTISFLIYPLFQGQFMSYHWLLFIYMISILSGLGLVHLHQWAAWSWRIVPVFIIISSAIFLIRPSGEFWQQVEGRPLGPPKEGRVDAMAGFLVANLRPGDRVQPLDWTGGAVHAMLIAGAPLATEFISDSAFYHAVSTEYIQGLRRRFVTALASSSPRFVVEVNKDKPWITGLDTTEEFPELRSLLASDYDVAQLGDGYTIYERKTDR